MFRLLVILDMLRFYSNYCSKEEQDQAIKGLEKAKGFIRAELINELELNLYQSYYLKADTFMEYAGKISKILTEKRQTRGKMMEELLKIRIH